MARRTKTVPSAPTPGSLRQRFRGQGLGPTAEPGRGAAPGAGPVVLPDVPPVAPPAQSAGAAAVPSPRRDPPGGRALFLVDMSAAFAVANEARYRTLEQVFGIRRADANLLTGVMALTLANAVYERAHRPKPPKPPTAVADLTIGMGVLRESIYGVAGPASRDTPLGGTLVAFAVLVGLTRQPVSRSIHGMRVSSRRLYRGFRARYGHLIPDAVEERLPDPV